MQTKRNAFSRLTDRRILVAVSAFVIALVLLVAINLLSGVLLSGVRADLTENKLFTLSDGTKKILAGLEEPLTLRFFRSKELSDKYLGTYAQRVEELLQEYRSRSGGKIAVEVLDPEPFSETEEECWKYAIQGVPVREGTLYFGIAGSNSFGDQLPLAFLDPSKEEFLEYELSKLVSGLAKPTKLVVGVLSSLPIEGQMDPMRMNRQAPQPWYVVDQLRQVYETKSIMPGAAEIPADVSVLLIVHPKNLPDATLYAIDQFVLRGGKAVVFVDPFCEVDNPPQDPNNPLASMMAPRASGMPKLFDAWGLQLAPDKIAADKKFATGVQWNNRGRPEPVDYVCWSSLPKEACNADEVTTAELKNLFLKTPGILEPKGGATTQFVPLLTSSDESMELATSQIQFQPDPPKLLADFFPSGKKITLAARITGKVKTAFPDGKPKGSPEEAAPAEGAAAAHLAESNGDANLIVVADADMLDDDSWVRVVNFGGQRIGDPQRDNGAFLFNVIDYLHGSTDLVSLRARGRSSYPFKVVEDIKRAAEASYRAEEQRLTDEKTKAERELNDLISKGGEGVTEQVLMSAEVQSKIADLRKTLTDTSRRLREVRYNLGKDVESLGKRLKLINIVLVPLGVLVAALFVFVYRANRRKAA